MPLLFAPGTAWQYSLATDVAGAIIEKVHDRPLDQAVQDLVTSPLGMNDTAFVATDPQRLATSYVDAQPQPQPRRMIESDLVSPFEGLVGIRFEPARASDVRADPSGGAGMVGSAQDFMKLLEMLRTGTPGLWTGCVG